jgi:hypothetical protein
LFADCIDTAEHHVIDQGGIKRVAIAHRLQDLRRQRHRGNLVKAAVSLAAAARRSHRVVYECLSHNSLGSDLVWTYHSFEYDFNHIHGKHFTYQATDWG